MNKIRLMMPRLPLFTTQSLNHYGISTFDALFSILRDPSIQPSFFHALAGLDVTKATRIDEVINPIQELKAFHAIITNDKIAKSLSEIYNDQNESGSKAHDGCDRYLKNLLPYFDELILAFPNLRFHGMMDFLCELSNGECVFVDIQLIPYENWDKRALSYVAALYGKRNREGGAWKDIKQVIGINILGGAQEKLTQWLDTPSANKPQFSIQGKLHRPSRFIDGIEIVQYSLLHTPEIIDKEKQDWLTLFEYAHLMSEEDICKRISTPAVLKAFECTKLSDFSPRVFNVEEVIRKCSIAIEKRKIDKGEYPQDYAEAFAEGYIEGYIEGYVERYSKSTSEVKCNIIKYMRENDESDTKIMEFLNLTAHQFQDYTTLMESQTILV